MVESLGPDQGDARGEPGPTPSAMTRRPGASGGVRCAGGGTDYNPRVCAAKNNTSTSTGKSSGGKGSGGDTPAMRQYRRFKEQHPGCVLFFRMGDFYEMFYDDAELAHRVLGVTLTQRTEGIPMAGVPYHAVEGYLRRMIQAGHRVAVCDQVQDASEAKGVVERDVTRVVTPGTLTDESLLDEGRENHLAAVRWLGQSGSRGKPGQDASRHDPASGELVAVAWAELSTGAFGVGVFDASRVADELARVGPKELLYAETSDGDEPARVTELCGAIGAVSTPRPGWQFRTAEARETLCKQFGVTTLAGFGFNDDDDALGPAGAVVSHLLETQKPGAGGKTGQGRRVIAQGVGPDQVGDGRDPGQAAPRHDPASGVVSGGLPHLRPPVRYEPTAHLEIDRVTLRSLEVERTLRSESADSSLLGVFESRLSKSPGSHGTTSGRGTSGGGTSGGCVTAMGRRTLRRWLCYPLREREPIERRQRQVGAMVEDHRLTDGLRQTLDTVHDVERIIGRVSVGRATPRDLVALGGSVSRVGRLVELLDARPAFAEHHETLAQAAAELTPIAERITSACVDAPPAHLREGGLIRDGFDAELDEARTLQRDSHQWLARYQKQVTEQTGVPSLKVGFNKVFGYYIEVTAANRPKMDAFLDGEGGAAWTRKQTLKNAERFITPELKEFEGKVLSAESRAVAREQALFAQLCDEAATRIESLRAFAQAASELDVLQCFATRAVRRKYCRPTIVDEPGLKIVNGRHPVLDELMGDRFVGNDVGLGRGPVDQNEDEPDAATLKLITGPNMAGKSTFIRQTALITLLAHTGSWVPADAATIGLCDRIFTRVGANDELHAGQSTFMVEMTETANICHHATPRSLVILDEIGRGTSTFDGLSLAWAITEHLAAVGCRTLFATHYHELTSLADTLAGVGNLHVTVREWDEQVVFLHRVQPGATDRSYGIHVAKIAGLPPEVVQRAKQVLTDLESQPVRHAAGGAKAAGTDKTGTPPQATGNSQLGLFTEYIDHPALDQLRRLDLNALSPLEAFDQLRRLQAHANGQAPDADAPDTT